MKEFGDWFNNQGWLEETKKEISPEKFREEYEGHFEPSWECVCGRSHYLKDIQSAWGWDNLDELVEHLENNKLYMGCNDRCIP